MATRTPQNDLEKITSVGLPIQLPKYFTVSEDLGVINSAIDKIRRYQNILGQEVVINYRVSVGFGTIEKDHALITKDRAERRCSLYRDEKYVSLEYLLEKRNEVKRYAA